MYEKRFWEDWWSNPSVSFYNNHYNIVDTSKYDIVDGKAVERAEYKKKRLQEEKEEIETLIKTYEKTIISKSKRLEDIEEELKEN